MRGVAAIVKAHFVDNATYDCRIIKGRSAVNPAADTALSDSRATRAVFRIRIYDAALGMVKIALSPPSGLFSRRTSPP